VEDWDWQWWWSSCRCKKLCAGQAGEGVGRQGAIPRWDVEAYCWAVDDGDD